MDLFKMMGQFKDVQSRMQTMQDEMSQRTFSALAGGGMGCSRSRRCGSLPCTRSPG